MAADSSLVLTVIRASNPAEIGREFVLAGPGSVVIGRAPPADFMIRDETVSRRHGELVVKGDGVTVRNLSSANGLFANGQPVEPGASVDLRVLEKLQLGGVLMGVSESMPTRNVQQRITTSEPVPATTQETAPLFTFTLDSGGCAVTCRGRLMSLAPSPALAFLRLCESPGQLVHQWDIQEVVGENANLAKLMTAIRNGVRQLMEQEALAIEAVVERVQEVHGSESVDPEDVRGLLRLFIFSRRGHGYLACVAPDDVVVEDHR